MRVDFLRLALAHMRQQQQSNQRMLHAIELALANTPFCTVCMCTRARLFVVCVYVWLTGWLSIVSSTSLSNILACSFLWCVCVYIQKKSLSVSFNDC